MASPITIESVIDDQRIPIVEVTYGSVSFGREPENTIVIDNHAVSRVHGVLLEAGSQWVYYDNESTNFSWLNSLKLNPYDLKIVRVGDVLKIANYEIGFSESSKEPFGDLPGPTPSALVFFRDKFKFEFSFSDPERPFKVGGLEAELLIDGELPATNQFRVEAASTGSLKFLTLEPSTSVYINGNQVGKGGQSADFLLRDSDLIEIGAYRILICRPSQADLSSYQDNAADAAPSSSNRFAPKEEVVDKVAPMTVKTNSAFGSGAFKKPEEGASAVSEDSVSSPPSSDGGDQSSPIFSLQGSGTSASSPSEQPVPDASSKIAGENLPMDVFHKISPSVPGSSGVNASQTQVNPAIQSSSSSNVQEALDAPIYSQENLPEHLRERLGTGSWLSESAKRKKRSSQSFVFNRPEAGGSDLNNEEHGGAAGLGLENASQTSTNRSISRNDLSGVGAVPGQLSKISGSMRTGRKTSKGSKFISGKLIYAIIPFMVILVVGMLYVLFLK